MPRDCWIFYIVAHWWLRPSSIVCMNIVRSAQKKCYPNLRPYELKYAFSIVWNCLNWNRWVSFLFAASTSCGRTTNDQEEKIAGRKRKNEIINFSVYWQMTEKGFVAHTNGIIMKTGRKYLVVNCLFFHSATSKIFTIKYIRSWVAQRIQWFPSCVHINFRWTNLVVKWASHGCNKNYIYLLEWPFLWRWRICNSLD